MTAEPTLHRVVLTLCSACIDGMGDQCHTPGCAFIRNRPPDFSIRDSCNVESIDGAPFDYDTLRRATGRSLPWLVVICRDGTSTLTVFTEELDAREFFDEASAQWSESFLAQAVEAPRDWKGTP